MPKTLLIVGGSPKIDWYDVFKGAAVLGGEEIIVEMAHWDGKWNYYFEIATKLIANL